MIYSASVEVEAPVYDTEEWARVREAVLNVFPEAEISEREPGPTVPGREYTRFLVGETHSVERFRELVDQQEITDTVRAELLDSVVCDSLDFRLKKQAAYVGRVNLDVGGHELGSLKVHVTSDDPRGLVDYVAPRTEEK